MRPMTLFVEWQNSDSAEFPKYLSPRCSLVLPARLLSQTNLDYASKPLTYHSEYYNKICQTERKTSPLLVHRSILFGFEPLPINLMLLLLSVHRVDGLDGERSWIKKLKLYVRIDHGNPVSSFRTKEIEYKIASWVDSNQVTL